MSTELGTIGAIYRYPVKSMCRRARTVRELSRLAGTEADARRSRPNIDRGSTSPALLTAVTRANERCAGVYATVTRTGRVRVGQRLFLDR